MTNLVCVEEKLDSTYSVMIVSRNDVWDCYGMKTDEMGETPYMYMFGLPQDQTPDIREAVKIALANVKEYDDMFDGD